MAKVIMLTIVVMCSMAKYRRAGFDFVKGENTISVNEDQFKLIQDDPRLSIKSVDDEPALELDAGQLDLSGVDDDVAVIVAVIDAEVRAGTLKTIASGAPDVAAIEALLAEDSGVEIGAVKITAKQRDDAWAVYKKLTGAE